MTPLLLDIRRQPVVRDVRCECAVCGAHATGWQAYTLGASCDNCGSYDMRPVPQPRRARTAVQAVPAVGTAPVIRACTPPVVPH
jgi:hypothetical protein